MIMNAMNVQGHTNSLTAHVYSMMPLQVRLVIPQLQTMKANRHRPLVSTVVADMEVTVYPVMSSSALAAQSITNSMMAPVLSIVLANMIVIVLTAMNTNALDVH